MNFSKEYTKHGIAGFYKKYSTTYQNPHVEAIQTLVRKHCGAHKRVLDLACGGGEVSLALPGTEYVLGADPYTIDLYCEQTKRHAVKIDFRFIALGGLFVNPRFDAVVISYALHLLERSWRARLFFELSRLTPNLYIIAPMKKQTSITATSWTFVLSDLCERTHLAHYRTLRHVGRPTFLPATPHFEFYRRRFPWFALQHHFCFVRRPVVLLGVARLATRH